MTDMAKHIKRMFTLLLTALLLFSGFACQKESGPGPAPTIHIGISTQAPETTPAPTPVLPAGERFAALDREVFTFLITQDRYTFRMLIKNPETYSIDPAAVPTGWGVFSAENDRLIQTRYKEYLTRLRDIPREELGDGQQLGYDAMEQFFENQIAQGEFPYYYEPLSCVSGFHSELPLLLGLYDIEDQADVEEYLVLLADVPRYLSQILSYERERAALGLFMTKNALDMVLTQLNAVISAGNSFYLIGTFDTALEAVPGLSESQKTAYRDRNRQLVAEDFIGAYALLRDGLSALSASCRENEGFFALGEEGTAYFELCMQQEGSALLFAEDALSLIEDEMFNAIVLISDLLREQPELADTAQPSFTTEDVQSDLAYLKELTGAILDPLPEHRLTVKEAPSELSGQLSAAMYLVPPVDDVSRQTVIINSGASKDDLLFAAAHEAYPGHLYQYVYERSLPEQSLFQQFMPLNGYSEGWAKLAEELMLNTQSRFNRAQMAVKFYNELIFYELLPAIVSIKVNVQGQDVSEIAAYLSGYGQAIAQNAEVYYRYAVDAPFYYFKYALGYCQMAQLRRWARSDLGDAYSERAYLMQYLQQGRAQINLLSERMDVWVDAQHVG